MEKNIIEKIELIEKEKRLIQRAIDCGICPKCGEKLKSYRIDESSSWTDVVECSENPNHYKVEDYDSYY